MAYRRVPCSSEAGLGSGFLFSELAAAWWQRPSLEAEVLEYISLCEKKSEYKTEQNRKSANFTIMSNFKATIRRSIK